VGGGEWHSVQSRTQDCVTATALIGCLTTAAGLRIPCANTHTQGTAFGARASCACMQASTHMASCQSTSQLLVITPPCAAAAGCSGTRHALTWYRHQKERQCDVQAAALNASKRAAASLCHGRCLCQQVHGETGRKRGP
jgi:hypothetical protein